MTTGRAIKPTGDEATRVHRPPQACYCPRSIFLGVYPVLYLRTQQPQFTPLRLHQPVLHLIYYITLLRLSKIIPVHLLL